MYRIAECIPETNKTQHVNSTGIKIKHTQTHRTKMVAVSTWRGSRGVQRMDSFQKVSGFPSKPTST